MGIKEYELTKDDLSKLLENIDLENIKFIFLDGKVGSGKTTLVKKIVSSCGVKSKVTSPTFSFVNEYEDKIFHYDMYNIKLEKFINIGLLDNLDRDGIHIFEWGDIALKDMLRGFEFAVLSIGITTIENEDKRVYKVVYG